MTAGDTIDLYGRVVTLGTRRNVHGRHIGRCRKCKATIAGDAIESWQATWTEVGKGLIAGQPLRRFGDVVLVGGTWRAQSSLDGSILVPCSCGTTAPVHLDRVKGTVTEHLCNARCMSSKGHVCECSCGGKNHGGAYLAAGVIA